MVLTLICSEGHSAGINSALLSIPSKIKQKRPSAIMTVIPEQPLTAERVDSSGIGNADLRFGSYDPLSVQLISGGTVAFDLPVGYYE